ncbi:MAG: putative toxin-antitoxin system toxin component, PIN family [Desulfobacterales bacterium]
MGSVKVVVDTNVLVSALLFGGIPAQLIPLWQRGKIKPLASKEIIDEYLRVFTYPKFKLTEEDVNFLLYHEILPHFEVIDVESGPRIIKRDPEDDKFIRCALAGKAKFIISGDQHLLALKSYQKIKILSPIEIIQFNQ